MKWNKNLHLHFKAWLILLSATAAQRGYKWRFLGTMLYLTGTGWCTEGFYWNQGSWLGGSTGCTVHSCVNYKKTKKKIARYTAQKGC